MQSLAIRSLLKFFFTKICFPLIMCFSKKIIFVGNALVCVLHKNFLDSLCFMLKYLMLTMELVICVDESRLNCTSPSLFYFFFFGKGVGSRCLPFSSDSKNFGENHRNANTYTPKKWMRENIMYCRFYVLVASLPSSISRNYFVVRILAVWY